MAPPPELPVPDEFVDSVTVVEYDADRERIEASYDGQRDSPTLAVVAVVATVLDRSPLDLTPLQYTIDDNLLERVLSKSADGEPLVDGVTFRWEGVEVTVSPGGRIEVIPNSAR